MADDKSMVGGPDRARVAGGEKYEVEHLALKHGLTPDEVRAAIAKVGNDRDAVERELAKGRTH
jgi:hypothetical protein